MTKTSCLGIWMDHANAYIIPFTADPTGTKITKSALRNEQTEDSLLKGEKKMHHKEQDEQWDFYRKLVTIIEHYTHVILFGPTDAKKELYNILKANHTFNNVKIEMKQTDKMSENQQHAFVKEYFSK